MNGSELNKASVLSCLGEAMKKNGKKYHIVKLGLLGSFTKDEINVNSDIDIAVELEKIT